MQEALRPSQLLRAVSSGHGASAGEVQRAAIWRALHCGFRASSVSTKPTGHVTDLAFSPSRDAPQLAVGSTIAPHEATLFDLRTGRCTVLGAREPGGFDPPAAHGATVSSVRFTASAERLVTASYDQTVRVWRASDGALLGVLGVAVPPPPPVPDDQPGQNDDDDDGGEEGEEGEEGEVDEAQGQDGGEVGGAENAQGGVGEDGAADAAPLDPAPWAYAGALGGHSNHVLCLATHPTRDALVASGGKDASALLWDLDKREVVVRLSARCDPLDLAFGRRVTEGRLYGAIDAPSHLTQGQLSIWDVATGTQLLAQPLSRKHVSCLHIAQGGETVLVGAADGSVRLLAATDAREVFTFRTGMTDVNLVSLSCDGTYVQASGDTNETFVLDVRRPDEPLHILTHDSVSHVNGVSACWCHTARSTLVTGSDDTLVRIWDVSRAQPELARLRGHISPVSCVTVAAGDELIASGGDEGKVVLYNRRTDGAGAPYLVGREQDNVLLRHRREDDEAEAWAETAAAASLWE